MKKDILVAALVLSLVSALLVMGCTKDEGKLPVTIIDNSACDTITYTRHIRPLLEQYCTSCHGNTPLPGASVLTTYTDARNHGAAIRSTVVDGIPFLMPQGTVPLSQAEKELISCWVASGMKE